MTNWSFDDPSEIAPPAVRPIPESTRGFVLRVELADTDPSVWRRLEVPGSLTLPELHDAIQASMGWEHSHLHQFRTGSDRRSPTFLNDFAVGEGEPGVPEAGVRLDQVIHAEGETLWYEYDFGDGWDHTLTIEAVLDEAPATARCTAAERACPPEDCGGIPGYAEFAAWARAGFADDAAPAFFSTPAEARDWLPDGWHPDAVDLDAINRDLTRWTVEPAAVTGEFADLAARLGRHPLSELGQLLRDPAFGEPTTVSEAEAARLTEQHRTFLDVIGTGVPLTAAGRLKPAVVRELAERLGITEWWIGAANREDQTFPVARMRDTVRRLGLVSVRKGVLAPTVTARKAADDPVALLRHIASRLPLGTDRFDRESGWLSLVVVGAGREPSSWDGTVVELLADAGWRSSDPRHPMPPADNPTLDALRIMNAGRQRWQESTTLAPGLSAFARGIVIDD